MLFRSKLLAFQASVDKRVKELDQLLNNGGLHRTVGKKGGQWTYSGHSESTIGFYESNLGITLSAKTSKFTRVDVWGTVRWTPTSTPSTRYSSTQLQRMARNLVFGLNVNSEAVWNAIPWSWLIDWFGNVGTYFKALNNQVPCTPSVPCIMKHTVTHTVYTRTDIYTSIGGGNGTTTFETKTRSLSGAGLSASIPFLSGGQLSTLAALYLQRKR